MLMTDEQKEHIRLWVAALRSGEFTQAAGALKKGVGFCCLGVASEVYRRETGSGEWSGAWFSVGSIETSATLCQPVVEWLGVDSVDPRTVSGDSFADMNDIGHADFPAIADAIEKTYLEVAA